MIPCVRPACIVYVRSPTASRSDGSWRIGAGRVTSTITQHMTGYVDEFEVLGYAAYGGIAYTPEGAVTADERLRLFRPMFPYLEVPLSGSPNPVHAKAE